MRTFIAIFSLILLISTNDSAFAAVAFRNISGSFVQGTTVVIRGSGLGLKNTALAKIWEQFRSGSNGDLLSLHGWKVTSDNDAGDKPQLSNSVVRHFGDRFSAKFHFPRTANKSGEDLAYQDRLPVTGTRRYLDYWLWFQMPVQSSSGGDSLTHQLKLARLQSAPGDISILEPNAGFDNVMVNGAPSINTYAWRQASGVQQTYNSIRTTSLSGETAQETGNYWSSNFVDRSWNHVQLAIDVGTEGNHDGILNVWLNGKQVLAKTTEMYIAPGYGSVPWFSNVQIGKYLGNTALTTTETTLYYSDIYYDDTWARVVLGDNSLYSSCTHTEIQPYSYWSDDTIKITLNKGTFKTGNPAFLFIIDENGNASSGQPINLSDYATPRNPSFDGKM
jgi:hypothetical protein